MKTPTSIKTLTTALIIAMGVSSFATINAIADDGTPPPAQTEEAPLPPVEDPVPTTVPAEETIGIPSVLPTDTSTEVMPANSSTLLDQIPENTRIIITSETGVEPLVTQAAANAFVIGDPIWCPESASSPTPGSNGCTGSYPTLSALVSAIDNGDIPEPSDNGIIWILSGNDLSASFISFDGSVFSNWRDYRLTLQGGWDGPGLDTTTDSSVFNNPIEIVNWNSSITLNDLVVNGASSSGLYVQTTGDITLNNISSNGNLDSGAELISNGNVTLGGRNQFSGNEGTGLYIDAGGFIDAQNVTANNNGAGGSYGYGADLTAAELNFSGTNVFVGNLESGMYAVIDGDIAISNMTASGNGTGGVYGAGAELVSSGSVLFSGANIFADNLSGGIAVEALGGISILDTQITNNLDTGAYLISDGDIVLDCSSVTGNGGYGVDADSPNLVFNGVELAQNSNDDAINNGSISYHSNLCFSYSTGSTPPSGGTNGGNGGMGNGAQLDGILPASVMTVPSGETTDVDCGQFSGSVVSLPDGDGAYLPCALGESVRLVDIEQDTIPDFLPRSYRFVSSFNLTVMKENRPLEPLGEMDSIWYWNTGVNENGQEFSQVLYWDGKGWVEVGDGNMSFLRVFFLVPESADTANLAILYWDGSNWVELRDNMNLGSGRFVHRGGHLQGMYFEAEVNFIGTFVLAQK